MTFPDQPAARAEDPEPGPAAPEGIAGDGPGQAEQPAPPAFGPPPMHTGFGQARQYPDFGQAPQQQPGFGQAPQQPDFGQAPQQQPGFGQAPQQPGFGAPGQGPGYPPPYAQYQQYQQPPQSGYGGPYGNPPHYYGHQPPSGGTNGMAIAAMVCGICGFLCLVPGLVGIILGVVSLPQIKRSQQSGRGMAITGIVVGSLWILAFILLLVFGHHGQQIGNSGGSGAGSGDGVSV